MSTSATGWFEDYRRKHSLQEYNEGIVKNAGELVDYTDESDVFSISVAPAKEAVSGKPKRGKGSGEKTFIRIVMPVDVYATFEYCSTGLSTESKRLVHTNLSGGEKAYSGGELWYNNANKIWVTGGAGRYPPRNENEFNEIVVEDVEPTAEWCATEGYTLDYFPIASTPTIRVREFASIVAKAFQKGFISLDTASSYLKATPEEFMESHESIAGLFLHEFETPQS